MNKRKIRVAINGFGRIGRHVFKIGFDKWNIVAVNDLPLPTETFAHLLKYDSLMGEYPKRVQASKSAIQVGAAKIPFLAFDHPKDIPWRDYGVDVVVESVGLFTDRKSASFHLRNGAKKVVISAPSENEDLTLILGLNQNAYDPSKHHILSGGSCTANCLAWVLDIVDKALGIDKAFMTTCHCYTQNQRLIDSPHKDLRRSRMAGINMIPTATTAMDPTFKVLPHLKSKLKGIAIRVPIPNVSLVEVIINTQKKTSKTEVNQIFQQKARKNIYLDYTEVPLVSSDFMRNPKSAIIAGDLTEVVEGNMVHVIAWYNNEWGYSNRIAEIVEHAWVKI